MAHERVDTDRTIREIREVIDDIDTSRAARMAGWIVATVEILDEIESGQISRDAKVAHWEPFNAIDLLTRKRDRRTDEVGRRKKELQELVGEPVSTNQEGRWQSVKHKYQHAVTVECERRGLNEQQGYLALEWMHSYTEYEHERSKERQARLRAAGEVAQPTEEFAAVDVAAQVQAPERARLHFGHLLPHARPPHDHQRSA